MGKKRVGKTAVKGEKEKQVQVKPEIGHQKKEKAKLLGKIYRQYSRRKYNKYKLQFPRLRESDLITKIIKEWQAFSEEEKLRLEKQFIETGGTEFLKDDSGSKSKSKSKSKSIKGEEGQGEGKPQDGQKPKKSSPKVRVFVQKATNKSKSYLQDDDSNFRKDDRPVDNREDRGESSENESVHVKVLGKKRIKRINQEPNNKKLKRSSEYLEFYKYYYNRLGAEHPRWSGKQITAIIKLLWRKRMMSGKLNKRKERRRRSFRIVSGRIAYRQSKQQEGFTRDQIKFNWLNLPYESKQYWNKVGRGGIPKAPRPSTQSVVCLKKVMKSGSEGEKQEPKHLAWMQKALKKQI